MKALHPHRRPLPRVIAAAALTCAAAASLTSCAASRAGDGKGSVSIGVTLSAASNPFYLAEGKAIQAAAAERGVKAAVQYANADVSVQSDQIDAFIRQRVGSIVVDAVDSDGIGPAVLRAKQAGIPVVAIDVTAPAADATVTSDNVGAGREACRYLFDRLGGKGKVAIVDGSAVSAIGDRMKGCREAAAARPEINVVAVQRADLTRDRSMNVAANILTAHPDVQGLFGVNDPTAIGIALAAGQRKAKVQVVGVDGAKQLTDLIGKGPIIGTSGQDPAGLGRSGLDLAVRLARKEKVDPKPRLVPTFLVNADTLSRYRSWG
ncbi:substrate-binding domain-containing protein [Actinomadura roseirufa]|uniref:substrate-binding domain-containing protein n=1 Tax=Actinomadura roseirufa TaxID=2094049 RepID=UPI0010410003|nr:substrate-binding domain-containing protein [Actinomadura roseirufa]